jgi:GxxExxY protein
MSLSHESGLGERVIGLGIAVHRHLGPGLLESAYEECLCLELREAGIAYRRQVPLPVIYKNIRLECGIVVENELVLEIKSVERLLPIQRGTDADLSPPQPNPGRTADELQ